MFITETPSLVRIQTQSAKTSVKENSTETVVCDVFDVYPAPTVSFRSGGATLDHNFQQTNHNNTDGTFSVVARVDVTFQRDSRVTCEVDHLRKDGDPVTTARLDVTVECKSHSLSHTERYC